MHTHRGFAVQNAHTSAGSTIRKVTSKKKERKVTRVKFFPPSSHGFNSCRLKLLKDDWGSLINFSRLKIFQLKSTYRVFFLKQEIKSKQKHKFLKWMLAKPFPGIRFFHGNSFPMMSHAYFRTKFSLISHPVRYFLSNKRLPSIPRRLATQKNPIYYGATATTQPAGCPRLWTASKMRFNFRRPSFFCSTRCSFLRSKSAAVALTKAHQIFTVV